MAKRRNTAGATPSGDESAETKAITDETACTEPSKSEPQAAMSEPADLPKVEAPKLADVAMPPIVDAARPMDAPIPAKAAEEPAKAAEPRANKFALLAASVAVAACVGALGGAIAASSLMTAAPAPAIAANPADDSRALAAIAQVRTDLAALRTSVEGGSKVANGQFSKIAERIDRVERAQAEPAAKIAKAVDALERIEKRSDSAKDITGSVAQPAATPISAPAPQIVEGWIVRDVYRGVAVVQGRRFGMIEVEPGDTIPGVGRVEAIRKQDGRWVVVTAKGIIPSPR